MKFVTNNNKSGFIKLFPLLAFKNLHSYINFDIINFSNINICKQIDKQKTLNISRNIETI